MMADAIGANLNRMTFDVTSHRQPATPIWVS